MPWSKYGVFLFSWCQVFAKEIQTSKDYPKVWLNHKNISADLLTNDGKIEINECMKIVSHRLVGIFFLHSKLARIHFFPLILFIQEFCKIFNFFPRSFGIILGFGLQASWCMPHMYSWVDGFSSHRYLHK